MSAPTPPSDSLAEDTLALPGVMPTDPDPDNTDVLTEEFSFMDCEAGPLHDKWGGAVVHRGAGRCSGA